MSDLNLKYECLKKISKYKQETINDIISILKTENIINLNELEIINEGDRVLNVFILLKKKLNEGKLHLLDFEWSILPIENIKITIITDHGTKEYSYSSV